MFILRFPLLDVCILHFPSLVKLNEEEMEELRAEVEKNLQMLLEVKGHLKQLAGRRRERGRSSRVWWPKREMLSEDKSKTSLVLNRNPFTVLAGVPHIMRTYSSCRKELDCFISSMVHDLSSKLKL